MASFHSEMNIYALEPDCDRHWNLRLVDEDRDWEIMYRFDGTPLAGTWQPIAVKPDDEEVKKLPASDCPCLFGAVPVLSSRAVAVLSPILEASGELLPLACDEGQYFIFNVLRMADALDEPASQVIRFPNSEKILEIESFVFKAAQVTGVDIFKVPQQPLGRVFVSDRVVEKVRAARLAGFIFEWLWASEQQSSSPVIYTPFDV